jgi:hypothetical protein
MRNLNPICYVRRVAQTVMMRAAQVMRAVRLRLRSRMARAAEALFLQKQFALYEGRNAPSHHHMHATRLILVWLSYGCDWQPALTIVRPATFTRWRRQGWRLVWTQPAPVGRPPLPPERHALIRRMAREHVTWGQQRIANELGLKLGLRVSPRTVRKYMPRDCVSSPGQRCQSQRWSTFIRNHATGLVVTGVTAEMARRAKAALAHMRQRIQRLTNWASQGASIPMKPHNTLDIVRRDGSFGLPVAVSLNRADHLQRVERSPPEQGLSRKPEPMSAATALSAARVEVCSVTPARCRRVCQWPKASGIASALSGVMRSDALRRAAG